MLFELAKFFTGGAGERRGHARKTLSYPVRWMKDANTHIDGVGQEISPTGALFILKDKPAGAEFTIAFKLGERAINARVTTLRHDEITQNGTTWHRFATKFAGISADDWDAIVRFVNDLPEPENKATEDLKTTTHQDDNAFRLLPLVVQKQIIDTLVQANRLAPTPEGQAPLLRMTYSGSVKRGTQQIHRCHVHSRLDVEGEIRQFDTTFLIDETGKVQVQSAR